MENSCITLTFGDQAENHKGMQMIGKMASSGLNRNSFIKITKKLDALKISYNLYNLSKNINIENLQDSHLLIIKDGVNMLLNKNDTNLIRSELLELDYDKKAFMYGRVINKNARHNLCLADFAQEPDYENGKGRIVNFSGLTITQKLRNKLREFLDIDYDLMGELNYYYNTDVCGIGYHGDTERKVVVGVRFGKSIPLAYQWYYKNNKIGKRIVFNNISDGDIYIMSEKALGNDWKKSSIYTLRHAAGCNKFID